MTNNSTSRPARIGVLGSGKGSNFKSIAEAAKLPGSNYEVVVALVDQPDAGMLELAKDLGIPAQYVDPGQAGARLSAAGEKRFIDVLKAAEVDLVALGGFMRILQGPFLRSFPNRVLNIHPSLLPAFPGLEAWKQAFEYGVKITGCTVHIVDQGVDTGPILGQRSVRVDNGDTIQTLHQKIQEQEWSLYPEAISEYWKSIR